MIGLHEYDDVLSRLYFQSLKERHDEELVKLSIQLTQHMTVENLINMATEAVHALAHRISQENK